MVVKESKIGRKRAGNRVRKCENERNTKKGNKTERKVKMREKN